MVFIINIKDMFQIVIIKIKKNFNCKIKQRYLKLSEPANRTVHQMVILHSIRCFICSKSAKAGYE